MVSTQWFVRMKPLGDLGLEAVRSGRIRIIPDRFTKVYYNWLENIRDWCISRQLWWGHRIPAWHCAGCGAITVSVADPAACERCGSPSLTQDPDVLDTWFSSGLWPFSTLGWPDATPDLRRYYPTSVMETGYDILFFWVARMIMSGLLLTNDVPFHTVYLHGLVRDDQGRKLSKTYGNGVDPLALLDGAAPQDLEPYIRAQYPEGLAAMGADALRFTLLTGSTPGNDLNLSVQRVEGNRNFTNKIWNATRYVLSQLGPDGAGAESPKLPVDAHEPGLAERWITSRLNATVREVTRLMEAYQYGEAGRQVYEFFWNEYCDWYLEISKIALSPATKGAGGAGARPAAGPADGHGEEAQAAARAALVRVLDASLRLLHPFIPFVTEETWGYLKRAAGGGREPEAGGWPAALIVAPWPQAGAEDPAAEAEMGLIMEIVRGIRNARAEYEVQPGHRIPAMLMAGERAGSLQAQAEILHSLARLDPAQTTIVAQGEAPKKTLTLVAGPVTVYLPLAGLIDLGAERERLRKELADLEAQIGRSQGLLGGPFAQRAPAEIVQREQAKLADLQARAARIQARLADLD